MVLYLILAASLPFVWRSINWWPFGSFSGRRVGRKHYKRVTFSPMWWSTLVSSFVGTLLPCMTLPVLHQLPTQSHCLLWWQTCTCYQESSCLFVIRQETSESSLFLQQIISNITVLVVELHHLSHVVTGVDPLYSRLFMLNIKKSSPTEETPTVSLLEVSTSGSCNSGEWIIFI